MKLLYDFFPIILFFVAYKLAGIYAATIVAILASLAQLGHFWLRNRRFETSHLVSFGLILVLGGLTLILREKSFIMWKPTLVNWVFAGLFILTSLFGSKPLIQRLLGSQLSLPAAVWNRLSLLWIAFFVVSGAINLYFVKSYQQAELALRSAVPAIQQEQLSSLECDSSFAQAVIPLCETARDRENTWVNFKLFGMLGLTLVFVLLQGFFLYRHLEPEENSHNNTPV